MSFGKTILACVDFSETSRNALREAERIAQDTGARLDVLHVIDSLAVTELAEALHVPVELQRLTALADANRELARWLAAPASRDQFHAESVIGTPLDEILKHARESTAGMIILGVSGSNKSSVGAGAIATKVLRHAPMDVLLVAGAHHGPYKRIIAGVDFSPSSAIVVERARQAAARDHGKVTCLHIFNGPWHRLHYRMETTEASPDFRQQYRGLLQRQLNEFIAKYPETENQGVLHDASNYGEGIADFARESNADLIVLGKLGHSSLRYTLMGTTAERLLRVLPCSILMVKPPQVPASHAGD